MNLTIHKVANGYICYPTPHERHACNDSETHVFETFGNLTDYLRKIMETKEEIK